MIVNGGQMLFGDCLDVMADIPDGSVDMVLCDLPYGTTQNKWDAIIPFEPLWAHYWRVAKPNAAIVLTAAQPFTSALVMSQIDSFKYEWIWRKSRPTGQLNAKREPLRDKEDIPVFYRSSPVYNPQKTTGKPNHVSGRPTTKSASGNWGQQYEIVEQKTDQKYPRAVIDLPSLNPVGQLHPTQKPVALFEYLIRTYTNEGETVLDNCSGSGTTAIAAINSGRRFICIEQDVEYYYKSLDRVRSTHMSTANFIGGG